LVVQNDAQQRAVDLKMPVVVDEAHVTKFVHEMANPRSGRPDHFGECLLADLGNYRLWPAFLSEIREQKKDTGKSLLS
jgi:hypothetical protein